MTQLSPCTFICVYDVVYAYIFFFLFLFSFPNRIISGHIYGNTIHDEKLSPKVENYVGRLTSLLYYETKEHIARGSYSCGTTIRV